MAQQSREYLKGRFAQGAKPSVQDYADLIDSFLLIPEQTAVDQQVVNQKLATYDSDLKAVTPGLNVNTLGDLFQIFQGYTKDSGVAQQIDGLKQITKWTTLPGKPTNVNVIWDTQTISTSAHNAQSANNPKWIVSEIFGANSTNRYMVVDIQISRYYLPDTSIPPESWKMIDKIVAIKVGVNPTAFLQ
ncbi:hypothetical protein ACO2Q8_07715 [Larkinella sp. VNQ87]|uniref:hypothetical protein n=1 Tax=Larkinella sp. VNQ87 TaxID=3400921 RepID=UPI003C10DDE1